MSPREIVSPLALKHTNEVMCTAPWFVTDTEYAPRWCTYLPLINGEEAFEAVHHAIENATKSVDIICWGFQPSMYFIRDGKHPSIGELLEQMAKKGVRVRILGWEAPLNQAGTAAGESNLPGKGPIRFGDRAGQTASEDQYAYDREWFSKYAPLRPLAREAIGEALKTTPKRSPTPNHDVNPLFISRGFDSLVRTEMAYQAALHGLDSDLSVTTLRNFFVAPSHHQKTVIVDFELPERAVGFVMGHNMLDEYWDTDKHSAWGRTKTDMPAPNKGPRGHRPRQDISSRVTGPILTHLHHNFASAWRRATSEDLFLQRNAIAVSDQLVPCKEDPLIMAQLLRTQSEEGRRDIEKVYLQAINNATQFIYIENQYFRWPPLADAILKAAKVQSNKGRTPEEHGVLYLFVVTNANDEGVGPGIVNTQRMLERLGREDGMTSVTKLRRIKQAEERAAQLEPAWHDGLERKALEALTSLSDSLGGTSLGSRAREAKQEDKDDARQRRIALDKEIEQIRKNPVERPPERPGLKVHICSLVAKDSPADAWMPVYIHSKLMIVDDAFTTHGSANINTRSMQVDSELNIAHEMVDVTQDMRRRLWDLHTDGKGAQDDPKAAFEAWSDILQNNKNLQEDTKDGVPDAPIVEFEYNPTTLMDGD